MNLKNKKYKKRKVSKMNESKIVIKEFPENGVVKATMPDCSDDVVNTVNQIAENASHYFYCGNYGRNNNTILMDDYFEGMSKIHPDSGDTYDFKTGKVIAKNKCVEKYNKSFDKKMVKVVRDAENFVKALKDYCDNHYIKY